jgi:hypothetical protein
VLSVNLPELVRANLYDRHTGPLRLGLHIKLIGAGVRPQPAGDQRRPGEHDFSAQSVCTAMSLDRDVATRILARHLTQK